MEGARREHASVVGARNGVEQVREGEDLPGGWLQQTQGSMQILALRLEHPRSIQTWGVDGRERATCTGKRERIGALAWLAVACIQAFGTFWAPSVGSPSGLSSAS